MSKILKIKIIIIIIHVTKTKKELKQQHVIWEIKKQSPATLKVVEIRNI